jgi:hypothetical protein
MGKYSEVFVGIDTAKKKHAVAVADAGRDGETRYLGEIDSAPATIERLIKKLASKYEKVRVCYEAGPTDYGLYRQIITLGHECAVVAPSMIPKKPGDRIKTWSGELRPISACMKSPAGRDLSMAESRQLETIFIGESSTTMRSKPRMGQGMGGPAVGLWVGARVVRSEMRARSFLRSKR